MPRREDDDVAPRPDAAGTRTLPLVGGFVLAVTATLAVFLTDNAQYLKLAVVAVAWAFVLATFAAGRRSTDRVAAASRERELRRAYERELEREVAARHEYELELENELRRETEESMRYELDALRGDIAALSSLRDEVARVSELRGDIESLASLRDEVARVAALRDDVAALSALRQDLGQLAELRADMSRLRAELTEQLSGEMLVERIVMRTQASRLTGDQAEPGRALEAGWTDDVPPRELTGGWPAVRLDEPRETQHFEQMRVERAGPRPPVPNRRPMPHRRTPVEEHGAVESRAWDAPLPTPAWEVPPTTTWPALLGGAPEPVEQPPPPRWSGLTRHEDPPTASRHAAHEAVPATTSFPMAPPTTAAPPPSPLEWLAARSPAEPSTSPSLPEVPPRRRRGDDEFVDPAAAPTMQRPAVPPAKPAVRIDDRGGYRVRVREEPDPEPTTQGTRVAEILAENGMSAASGGRRRRRYRDEDGADDVLARVLRGN